MTRTARQIAAVIAKDHGWSWKEVARHFRMDHSTFVKGSRSLAAKVAEQPLIAAWIERTRALVEDGALAPPRKKEQLVLWQRGGVWSLEPI